MILEINSNQEVERNRRSNSLINKKSDQSNINSENIFAYDVKYMKIFEKKKVESDDDFYQTFENLKHEKYNHLQIIKMNSNDSIKEESLIDKGILNLINSPQQNCIVYKCCLI